MSEPPSSIRVVVLTTFEIRNDTGGTPGEFQNWVENLPLPEVLPFPQGYHPLRYNPDRHCQLVGLGSRWRAMKTARLWLRHSGDTGDLGPNPKGLGPGGTILGGGHLMTAEVEEVVDPVMGGEETLRLAG